MSLAANARAQAVNPRRASVIIMSSEGITCSEGRGSHYNTWDHGTHKYCVFYDEVVSHSKVHSPQVLNKWIMFIFWLIANVANIRVSELWQVVICSCDERLVYPISAHPRQLWARNITSYITSSTHFSLSIH